MLQVSGCWSSGVTTVSVTADAVPGIGGAVSVNGDTAYSLLRTNQVNTGTPSVIEAIAAPGYRFLEWTGNLTGS